MHQHKFIPLCVLTLTLLLLSGCALVKTTGEIYEKVGKTMEEYGQEKEGFVGSMATLSGKMGQTVGTALQDAADNESDPDKKVSP